MTDTPNQADKLTVTQRAREAAADYHLVFAFGPMQSRRIVSDEMRTGCHDKEPLVQAFARFEREILATHSGEGRSNGAGEDALDRIEAAIDAAERCMNASPFWDDNSRHAGKALLDYPRSQITAERAALQRDTGGDE